MTLDAPDLADLRAQKKQVRHCPSCGYRRVMAKALRWTCQVCHFQFFVASDVKAYRCIEVKGDEAEFDVLVRLTVPTGREGVRPLAQVQAEMSEVEPQGDGFFDGM